MTNNIVEEQQPLKQGLKPTFSYAWWHIQNCVGEQHPLKQSL